MKDVPYHLPSKKRKWRNQCDTVRHDYNGPNLEPQQQKTSKDMEQSELLFIVGGKAKWQSFGRYLGNVSQN